MTQLQRHPLSAAWPDMSEAEYVALRDDIEVNGQLDDIMLLDGKILDGWHRYRACNDLLLEPRFAEWPADQDPRPWVRSKNGARRHLTASQLALAITATNSYLWAPKGANQHGSRGPEIVSGPQKTEAELAAEVGVSDRLVRQAKVVVTDGAAAVQEAVKTGALPLHEAEKIARLPKEKQGPEVQRRVKEKKQPKPKKPREPKPKAAPKPAEKPADPALDAAFGGDDIGKLLEQTQAELAKAQAEIQALQADDARAEALKWRRVAADAQEKQAALMDSAAQSQRQLTWYANQLRRIGKAVGEDDVTKVAAIVEAKMRALKVPA